MKKIKISETTLLSSIVSSDEFLLKSNCGVARITYANLGMMNEKLAIIPPGAEFNTEIKSSGLFQVRYSQTGNTALFNIGILSDQNNKINEHADIFRISDVPGKICIFRKSTAGPIFIKNNINESVDVFYSRLIQR